MGVFVDFMYLSKIELSHYRNYKKEKVQNTVKLDTNNVKEKNKEQEKQKKKGFC